jgi:hypothetical protein
LKFTSDRQRKAMFANLSSSMINMHSGAMSHMNRFAAARSETGESLAPIFQHYGERPMINRVINDPYEVEGFTGSKIISGPNIPQEHAYVAYNLHSEDPSVLDQAVMDNDTIILAGDKYKYNEYLNDPLYRKLNDDRKSDWVRGYARSERKINRPVYSKQSKIEAIDKMLNEGCLSPSQEESLFRNRRAYLERKEFSRKKILHPKKIGSSWEGRDYKHGPRIMDPDKFVFVRNVKPDEKYRHFDGGDKIPENLPEGSMIVIGKLKEGDWGVQSIITPKK